jgi:uncharacterized protein (DUF433 family)
MLDRHAVQAMRQAGERPRRIATHFGISVRTVWRIAREPAVTAGEERAARRARQIGRPPVPTVVNGNVVEAVLVRVATGETFSAVAAAYDLDRKAVRT